MLRIVHRVWSFSRLRSSSHCLKAGLTLHRRHLTQTLTILHRHSSCMAHLPLPDPPVLQRDLFSETVHLVALRIPKKECQAFMKLLYGSVSALTFSSRLYQSSRLTCSCFSNFLSICAGTHLLNPSCVASCPKLIGQTRGSFCLQRRCKTKVCCIHGPHF